MSKTELIVIMPVYNEDEIVSTVINKWLSELQNLRIDHELHVYNDGSKDGTLSTLNKLSANNKKLIVHDKPNTGHGPTILMGYQDNCGKAKWIFQVDSDDEIGTEAFRKLWENRFGYDLIIGKRSEKNKALARKILSGFSRLLVGTLFGAGIHDVNCPYRLMEASTFYAIYKSLPPDAFAPNILISGIACLRRLKIMEVPITHKNRTTGVSSIRNAKLLGGALKSLNQTLKYRLQKAGQVL